MSNHSRRNETSMLLSDQENDSIFNVLGRGCLTLSTAVVQLFLSDSVNKQTWNKKCCGVVCFEKDNPKRSYFIRLYDPINQQKTWEQELYIHFKYKTPREFFHTFEAHDCQAGLNFASEEEANIFKQVVLGKLSDRQKKRQEKRKQQDGSSRMPPRSTGEKRTVNLSSVSAGDTTPNKPVVNTVKEKSKSKDKGKGGGKKKITKADISTPTQFRHVGHVGWDPESGLQTEKLDPELGALFEEIGINTQMDDDTMDFIYDFVDKHGGLDAVKKDLASRKPPAVTPPTTGQDKPSHLPARPAFAAPDPPGRGQAPPPPSRPSRPSAAPPPTPSRQGQQHSGGTGRNVPPPPPLNIPAAPPPPPPSSATPPPTSAAPPPPPFKKSTETSTPPQSSGRTGLLDAIVNFKSASLSHVKADENVGKSVSSSVEAPGGIAAALMDALNKRKPAMQLSDDDDDRSSDEMDDDDDDEWDD